MNRWGSLACKSVLLGMLSLALLGCECEEEDEECVVGEEVGSPQSPVVYPLTDSPYTTLQMTWKPLRLPTATKQKIFSGELTVYDHEEFHDHGIGVERTEGIPWKEHRELAENFVEATPESRKSLAYFWIVADPQVIDEESPIRFENADKVYRPQGHLTPQTFEAHVRTAQRFNELSSRPFDFALMAGDLTDGGQKNEVDWILTSLAGGIIDPDSGVDNDIIPGPGNDHNDPFISDGLQSPWYTVLGNHDSLYNGGFGRVTENIQKAAVGKHLYLSPIFGLINWPGFMPGDSSHHKIITNPAVTTPADENRYPLTIHEIIQAIYEAEGEPSGHGFTQENVDKGIAYFSVKPIEDKPIRLIMLHTTDSYETDLTISFAGSLDRNQFDWFKNELEDSALNNELVIVMSHHRLSDFHHKSEVPSDELEALMLQHPNVVLHLTGHGHKNSKTKHETTDHGGYWELMTASTMDFPMHSRIVEIVDEGNGYLSIYVTNLDHNSPEDSLAHLAREIGAGKAAFTTAPILMLEPEMFWQWDVPAQNLLLRVPIPNTVLENLNQYEWASAIESIETLNALPSIVE